MGFLNDIPVLAWVAFFAVVIAVMWLYGLRQLRRLTAMEMRANKAVPFWQGIQAKAIKRLTHPHEAAERADELLQILLKDPVAPMSDEDRAELERRMRAVAAGEDPLIQGKEERDLAGFMPIIMKNVEKEHANPNPIEDVQLLGIKKESVE